MLRRVPKFLLLAAILGFAFFVRHAPADAAGDLISLVTPDGGRVAQKGTAEGSAKFDPEGKTAQPTRDVTWVLDSTRCVNATWGTGNDGGVLAGSTTVDAGLGNITYPIADVEYRCAFDGSGAALCWRQGGYPYSCSQTSATLGGTSRHFQGGEKDIAFIGPDAGAAAWGTVRAIDVYGLAQSGVMVISCCPWVARAQ
jgi:hypothetical protein